jgi:hypothetical protein
MEKPRGLVSEKWGMIQELGVKQYWWERSGRYVFLRIEEGRKARNLQRRE